MEIDDCQPNGTTERIADPVGVSILFSIFNTTLKVLGLTVESGGYAEESAELRVRFRQIREEILSLHNTLDDFVLLLHRYVGQSENPSIEKRRLTVSETLLALRERDYQRWKTIQDSIEDINRSIYDRVREIRALGLEYLSDPQAERAVNHELIHRFDETILTMGQVSFVEFIQRLREHTSDLETELSKLSQIRQEG